MRERMSSINHANKTHENEKLILRPAKKKQRLFRSMKTISQNTFSSKLDLRNIDNVSPTSREDFFNSSNNRVRSSLTFK